MVSDKLLSAEEFKKHQIKGDLWLAIHGKVYDVSGFMENHPGGADALLDQAGLDSTAAFEDVGHSSDARSIMNEMKIGNIADKLDIDSRITSAEFMKLENSKSSKLPTISISVLLLFLVVLFLRMSWS